jgi:predicted Fe-Mo cluster-binding NifX family protein
MKIAVSISKPDNSPPISEVFGGCSHYYIYDTENKTEEILSNPYFIELGGAGIQSSHFLIDLNVDVLITKKIGINPLRFLISANVKVYKCNAVDVNEVIKLFDEGQLTELKSVNEKFSFGRKRKRFNNNFINKRGPI